MNKYSLDLKSLSKKDFKKITSKMETGTLVFKFDKAMEFKKTCKLIADLIEDDWSVTNICNQGESIVANVKRREKKQFVFPKEDSHFDRKKDRYQYHTLLAAMMQFSKRRNAIDIGGHIGLYSSALLESFDSVISFEPAPENIICFKKNAPKAILYEYALGEENKEAILNIAKDNSGNNSLVEDFNHSNIKVQVRTLDSFNFKEIDLIKIDVQGYEEQVLIGSKDTIIENHPILIVELITHKNSPPNMAAMKILESYNYKVLSIIGKDYILGPK